MALSDFWTSVRVGARLLAPKVASDSPRIDLSAIEQRLRSASMWLTPKSVEGFDEQDFSFLLEPKRNELRDHVNRFRDVAREVPSALAAEREQVDRALPEFMKIIELLEFDKYGDAEAYRIGNRIEQLIESSRPRELVDLRFETHLDHSGDPAIWIWAIIKDEGAAESVFPALTRRIRDLLVSASRQVAPERWPYVRFRTASEQTEVTEVAAS